jgi:hypothetical protein
VRIQSFNSWANHTYGVQVITGRAIITGSAFSNSTVSALKVDSTAGAGMFSNCEIDSITTPFNIDTTVMRKWVISAVLLFNCTDALLGGNAVQPTSKSTAVTLNAYSGNITMNAAALATLTNVNFTWTNNAISAIDSISHSIVAGSGTPGAYTFSFQPSNGSCNVSVRNATAGSLSEGVAIQFALNKAAVIA